jgi:hypothetical protein
MNSIIEVYSLSLEEAINTRDADGAKDAALTKLSQIIEKGCVMPMDRLTIKKLRADKQLVPSSKLFLKVKYLLAGGGHRQNHDDYESTSLPAVATSSVPMVAARSAKCGNARMSTDVSSAYPHGDMRSAMPMVCK